jgi:hypothetical protein
MSRKTFTFLTILLLAIVAGGVWYFFFYNGGNGGAGNNATSTTNLFPFGQGNGGQANGGQTTTKKPDDSDGQSTNEPVIPPRLRHISMVPTAGVVSFDQASSSTKIRYIERATGHIYETSVDSSDVKKISNTTLPKIHEALWVKDGKHLLARYLKEDGQTIRTFYAQISDTSDMDNSIEGTFLDDGIKDISILGDKIFYFTKNSLGEQGIVANTDGSKKTAVFNSTYADWSEKSDGTKFVTLYSRPSASVLGSTYILNATTGDYSKVAGDMYGMIASANTDGNYVLLSGTRSNAIYTSVMDIVKGIQSNIGVATLVDKCVWSQKEKTVVYCAVPKTAPRGEYPDIWYKGGVSLNDSLWRIDVSSNDTEQVFDPVFEGESEMDMMSLSLNNKEDTLVFINKKDMTAWSYKLGL